MVTPPMTETLAPNKTILPIWIEMHRVSGSVRSYIFHLRECLLFVYGGGILQEHPAEMPHISIATANHIQGYLGNNHSRMIVYV